MMWRYSASKNVGPGCFQLYMLMRASYSVNNKACCCFKIDKIISKLCILYSTKYLEKSWRHFWRGPFFFYNLEAQSIVIIKIRTKNSSPQPLYTPLQGVFPFPFRNRIHVVMTGALCSLLINLRFWQRFFSWTGFLCDYSVNIIIQNEEKKRLNKQDDWN